MASTGRYPVRESSPAREQTHAYLHPSLHRLYGHESFARPMGIAATEWRAECLPASPRNNARKIVIAFSAIAHPGGVSETLIDVERRRTSRGTEHFCAEFPTEKGDRCRLRKPCPYSENLRPLHTSHERKSPLRYRVKQAGTRLFRQEPAHRGCCPPGQTLSNGRWAWRAQLAASQALASQQPYIAPPWQGCDSWPLVGEEAMAPWTRTR
jgi:hypothetical protein